MHLDNHVIREMRLDRGWTQQQLADACGLSMRTVQRVEQNGIASLETTAALGSVFGVERRALLRVSSPREVGAVSDGNLRLVLLGVVVGIILGVLATLTLVSAKANADPGPFLSQIRETAVQGAPDQGPGIGDRGSGIRVIYSGRLL